MRSSLLGTGFVLVGCVFVAGATAAACGSSSSPDLGGDGGGGGSGSGNGSGGSSGSLSSSGSGSGSGGSSSGSGSGGGLPCPPGLTCDVACSNGKTTTITGTVYDPAKKNPLYNVAVFVPATPLTPLGKGVLTGADACDCGALFKSGAITNTVTGVDGKFTLKNVPVGSSVPFVIQVGKWRRQFKVNVTSCQDNPQADKSIFLPGTIPAGNTDDNMPDIAVSTGSADSLECLLTRIGIPASEYVAGAAKTGHVHVFSGGDPNGANNAGTPEQNPMLGAPTSATDLWSTQAQLMPYDITLLSCEGGETASANPPALEAYLNAGGRAFASHFHYAWFSGPLGSTQGYTATADWGTNLATWQADQGGGNNKKPIGGVLDLTLNGSTKPFPKGVALQQWLTGVSALGTNGVAAGELAIYQPRYNATVGPANKPSQPWITSDATGQAGATMYFSFDTPVNAVAPPDGGSPQYCGRAVFSDLHVAGNPTTKDSSPPPGGCDNVDLSPQEKALEFMLFDLSSCVVPDTIAPPTDAGLPPPPK